jgi:hypothetical protein
MSRKIQFHRLHLLLALTLPIPLTALSASADFFEGDASLSSQGMPHVPEPLLFDLVRPLGAAKGELEVNVLAQHNLRNGEYEYAPEIEYAFADGLAIELELPFKGSHLEEYKVAVQGTFGTLRNATMVHGWQVIARKERHGGPYSADFLYLNGQALGNGWSLFNMAGWRRTEFSGEGRNQLLLNNSVFYDVSQRLTLGLELNSEIDHKANWRLRAIPQVHYDLGGYSTLQFGIGPSRLAPGGPEEWTFNWRLIRTF